MVLRLLTAHFTLTAIDSDNLTLFLRIRRSLGMFVQYAYVA